MRPRVIAHAIFALMLSALAGCASQPDVSPSTSAGAKAGQPQPPRQEGGEAALQVVDSKYVCMINNHRFDKV